MIIQSTRVYYEEKFCPKQVEITGKRITNVYEYGQFPVDKDYGDLKILPGLNDIHNHGYMEQGANNANTEWLTKWMNYLIQEGVTGTLPSISCGNPHEVILDSLRCMDEFASGEYDGCRILGIYSEGPFVGQKPGAQNVAFKLIPTKEIVDDYINASGGRMKYIMLAPEELNGDYSVLDYIRSKGISISLGHTGASFEVCTEARAHGAISFTHTFNGMLGLGHREPGVAGAALYYDDMYAELIGDGVHVNKVPANILARMKGKDKLILVTDSVEIKGLPVGKVGTRGKEVFICEDGVGRLANGTISGSANRLNRVLRYSIEQSKIDEVTAINAATVNPCKMLGINDLGLIKPGYIASIAVFDDTYEPVDVYVEGKKYCIQ
ncbi:MAG: N-acetylglucosamine-6-phosphate deacetylase [Erysipelotrichaceae bacterium]|nr:N-acetylglucosamine-6-phosphate deacetylase [Erysipelotrichaceae bacterium]